MKKIIAIVFLFLTLIFSIPQVVEAGYVRGYYRRDGTYVRPHYRSNPNGLLYDNYSYREGSLYNSSYNRYNTYKWNTPSWSWQDDYWSGQYYYNLYNDDYWGW